MMNTRKLMVDGLLEYIGQAGEEQQLPTGYMQVAWLSSKGAAKIDTGISGANNNLKIEMRFKYEGYASYKSFYGTYTNEDTDCTRLILTNSDNGGLYAYLNSKAGGGLTSLTLNPKTGWHDFWMTKQQTSLDGVVVATTGVSGKAASPTQTIKLFTHSATAPDTACTVYMSSFKIYDNGTLVRNFVPVVRLSDGKPGMYDKCGSTCPLTLSTFYISTSETEFTWGDKEYVYTPDLWLEADTYSSTAWTNKGSGGYDLMRSGSNNKAVVSDNAVVATSSAQLQMYTARNVVGTGSFIIEVVAAPSSALAGTQYGGWLCEQRTGGNTQPGSIQYCINKSGTTTLGGWDDSQQSIWTGMTSPSYVADTIQYLSSGYDARGKMLWCQVNTDIQKKGGLNFSCTVARFDVGYAPWNPTIPYLGSLYSLRVYTRALSEKERLFNRLIDRQRFGF
jgi:hypothetical protein